MVEPGMGMVSKRLPTPGGGRLWARPGAWAGANQLLVRVWEVARAA